MAFTQWVVSIHQGLGSGNMIMVYLDRCFNEVDQFSIDVVITIYIILVLQQLHSCLCPGIADIVNSRVSYVV